MPTLVDVGSFEVGLGQSLSEKWQRVLANSERCVCALLILVLGPLPEGIRPVQQGERERGRSGAWH